MNRTKKLLKKMTAGIAASALIPFWQQHRVCSRILPGNRKRRLDKLVSGRGGISGYLCGGAGQSESRK